jgi:hypothetical protein
MIAETPKIRFPIIPSLERKRAIVAGIAIIRNPPKKLGLIKVPKTLISAPELTASQKSDPPPLSIAWSLIVIRHIAVATRESTTTGSIDFFLSAKDWVQTRNAVMQVNQNIHCLMLLYAHSVNKLVIPANTRKPKRVKLPAGKVILLTLRRLILNTNPAAASITGTCTKAFANSPMPPAKTGAKTTAITIKTTEPKSHTSPKTHVSEYDPSAEDVKETVLGTGHM